jgi:hypothetical protein
MSTKHMSNCRASRTPAVRLTGGCKLLALCLLSLWCIEIADCKLFQSVKAEDATATEDRRASEPANALPTLKPPIRIGDAGAAGDGGTLFVELIGDNNERVTLLVTQNSMESPVPHDTLFLDVPNSYRAFKERKVDARQGRLPYSHQEAAAVLDLLKLAFGDEDAPGASLAKEAWSRLSEKKQFDVWDGVSDSKPKWLQAYLSDRAKGQAAAAEWDAREKSALQRFPADLRPLLLPSQGNPLDESEVLARASAIVKGFNDDSQMVRAICYAIGVRRDDSWRTLDETDEVMLQALNLVSSRDVIDVIKSLTLDSTDDAQMEKSGACRVLFDPTFDYVGQIEESEWLSLVPRYVQFGFKTMSDDQKAMAVDSISQEQGPAVIRILRVIAGDESSDFKDRGKLSENTISARDRAYLALATRNDQSIAKAVRSRLESTERKVDRAALEVSLANLGDHALLNQEHFHFRSTPLGMAALNAIDKYSGRYGMDILMSSTVLGRLSGVQQEGVALACKITGQQWQPSDEAIRTGDYAKEAADWWKANQEEFEQQLLRESQ